MKKITVIFSSAFLLVIAFGIAIIVSCLICLDFFGTNSTDGYVEDNMAYANDYKKVLNENIEKGYIPLERILYFYLAKDGLSFSKIYNDNLDLDLKRMKPITDVCSQMDYKNLSICFQNELKLSGQQTEYQNKPFGKPIDFSKVTITSFFMEQRIVFGSYDVHSAWDLASPAETEVYAVCDGTIEKVSFPYSENVTDTSGGGGNQIILKCNIEDKTYQVTYAHLFPNSSKVKAGDTVTKGQVLGGVGTTGYSTGNHLHYQVKADNKNVDGMSLIDFSDGSKTPPTEYFPKPDFGSNFRY